MKFLSTKFSAFTWVLVGVVLGLLIASGFARVVVSNVQDETPLAVAAGEGGTDGNAHMTIPRRPYPPAVVAEDWTNAKPLRQVPVPRSVILIGLDTLRASHLSIYGYHRDTSPELEQFADHDAVRFDHAEAGAPWTLPSVATVMTSLPPQLHGAESEARKLRPDVTTLAEAFGAQGWLTAAFVANRFVGTKYAMDRGFLEFRELTPWQADPDGTSQRAGELNSFAFPWLRLHRAKRFFLYLHYVDPHWDYDPPPPYDTKFTDPDYDGDAVGAWPYLKPFKWDDNDLGGKDLQHVVNLYDGEIAYLDSELGKLFDHLKSLKLYDDALIVIFSDHGEGFEEHGFMGHGNSLYEELLHAALLIKPPGGVPTGWNRVVDRRVGLIDVAPTVLTLADLRLPTGFEGTSLVPIMRNDASHAHPPIVSSTHQQIDLSSLIAGRWKLIHPLEDPEKGDELYDLETDPHERHDQSAAEPDRVAAMRRQLSELAHRWHEQERGTSDAPEVQLSPEEKAQLEALGYL